MGWDDNFYYNAVKNGLTIVTEVNWDDEPYSFDITAVWEKDGQFYLASDSGCSCPTPFERYESLDDCEGPFDRSRAVLELMQMGVEQLKGSYTDKDLVQRELLGAVNDLLDYEIDN